MKLSLRHCLMLAIIFPMLFFVTQTVTQQTCTELLYYAKTCNVVTCTKDCIKHFPNSSAVGQCYPNGCHCEYDCHS
ncbi:hypothetical protein VNO77_42064 [Canavalia gladiata]|uniref:Uncharacterized protein n=1 Tax=Canavalia gladiata TaxID=3824 RepID=A0AAN9K1Z9_CANGL